MVGVSAVETLDRGTTTTHPPLIALDATLTTHDATGDGADALDPLPSFGSKAGGAVITLAEWESSWHSGGRVECRAPK